MVAGRRTSATGTVKNMGKGGRKKNWPTSWRRAVMVGGTLTLKGRSFEHELVVLPLRVEVETPEALREKVDDAIVAKTGKQTPS